MLENDSGAWRRRIKTLVAGLDPEVAVLFGREDATGHHPLRLTLNGCRETLRHRIPSRLQANSKSIVPPCLVTGSAGLA